MKLRLSALIAAAFLFFAGPTLAEGPDAYIKAALETLKHSPDASPPGLVQGRSFSQSDGTTLTLAAVNTGANPEFSVMQFRPGKNGPERIARSYLTPYLYSDLRSFTRADGNGSPRLDLAPFITVEMVKIADSGQSLLVRYLAAEGKSPSFVCDTVMVFHKQDVLFLNVLTIPNTSCASTTGKNLADVAPTLRKETLQVASEKVLGWRDLLFGGRRYRIVDERYEPTKEPVPDDESYFRKLNTAKDVFACDLGARGSGWVTARSKEGGPGIRAALRLKGQVGNWNILYAKTWDDWVQVGRYVDTLRDGRTEAKCSVDGKLRLAFQHNPCSYVVYDLSATPPGSAPPEVATGKDTPECLAALKELKEKVTARERADQCSLTSLSEIRQAAQKIAAAKGPRAAFSHLKQREEACHDGRDYISSDPHVQWLVADAILYSAKAKDYEACASIVAKGITMDPYADPAHATASLKALKFNAKLCEGLRYIPSEDPKSLDHPGKRLPTAKVVAQCKDSKRQWIPPEREKEGDEDSSTSEQQLHWVGDLNHDGLLDAVIYLGMCGNRGDCMYQVVAGCGDSKWASVLDEDYFGGLEVLKRATKHNGMQWFDLQMVVGVSSGPRSGSYFLRLNYDGSKGYVLAPGEERRSKEEYKKIEEDWDSDG